MYELEVRECSGKKVGECRPLQRGALTRLVSTT